MKEPAQLSSSGRLRLARAYMAEHGFSPMARDNEGRCCFVGALYEANNNNVNLQDLKILNYAAAAHDISNFGCYQLTGVDTKLALAVFDAAIVAAEAEEMA